MFVVTDKNGVSEALLGVEKTAVIRETINDEYSLSFVVKAAENNIVSYPMVVDDAMITVEDENFIVKVLDDKAFIKSVTALHEFFEIVDDYVETKLLDGYYTIQQAVAHAFSNTPDWTYSIEGSYTTAYLKDFGADNPVALLQVIIDAFGIEYKPTSINKRVVIKKMFGIETDYQVRFKQNLVEVKRQIDNNDIKTAVKVYYNQDDQGNYLSSVIYYSPHRNKYRRLKWAEPLYLEAVTSQTQALALAESNINDLPVVSITCSYIHIQEAGYNATDIALGNSFFLIDERIALEDLVRITSIDRYPLDPAKAPKLMLSNKRKSITDIALGQQQLYKQLEEEAVKLKEKYSGVTISDEDGIKVHAQNGVLIWLNADRGILLSKSGFEKFFVGHDGYLNVDGRMKVSENGVTLFEAFMDSLGGRLAVYDNSGNLNVKIGSEEIYSGTQGGMLKLYKDYDVNPRVELGIVKGGSYSDGSGEITIRDGYGRIRGILRTVSEDLTGSNLSFFSTNGSLVTAYAQNYAMISGQMVATQPWVQAQGYVTASYVQNAIANALANYTPPASP